MTRPFQIATVVLFIVVGFLISALKGTYDTLKSTEADLKSKVQEVAALKKTAELDEQESLNSYEAAQSACRQNIRAAVAAVRLPKVQPEVSYAPEDPSIPVCDCPSTRLLDIQGAGAEDPNLPASSPR